MPYKDLTPKQRRTVDADVKMLFTVRGILTGQTVQRLMSLGPFHPWIETKNGSTPLSEAGVAALKRICETLPRLIELKDRVSAQETNNAIFDSYTSWIERELEPTGEEFALDVVERLVSLIKDYEFLVPIEGISIGNQKSLELGSMRVQASDHSVFDQVKFGGLLDRDLIYEKVQDPLWMLGVATGSPDVAAALFEQRVTLTVGILAVCGAVLYKGALRRSRIRPILGPFNRRKPSVVLRWDVGGDNPQITHSGGGVQDLSLDAEQVKYLRDVCRLQQMTALIVAQSRCELAEAVARALYWFADAHADRNHTMRFTKLWSCAESFFSVEKENVTELNVSGIASVLVFSGFQIVEFGDYGSVKKRLKALYDLRSRAVHRAEYDQIAAADIDELSHWIAWLIISMMTLMERGYRTLGQVREQSARLDSKMSRAGEPSSG